MRLIKRQTTNLRSIIGKGVQYDINDQVIVDSTNVMLIPKGTTAQRPNSAVTGHLRYNTSTNEFEAYQGSSATWKPLAYKEPTTIEQQSIGSGNATDTVFGPLDSGFSGSVTYTDYTAPVAAQNIIVLIENVFQLATTNYTLEQNPDASDPGSEIGAGSFVIGQEYYIVDPGDTDFTTLGAADNNANTVFTATGTGDALTTGTARQTGYYVVFGTAVPLGKPVTALHNFDK